MLKEFLYYNKNEVVISVLSILFIICSFFSAEDYALYILPVVLVLLSFFIKKINYVYLFLVYILFFTILCVLELTFWKDTYDPKDILGSYLFFGIIPLIFSSLSNNYFNVIQNAIKFSWVLLSFSIILWGIKDGVDWSRNTIFGIKYLHKNFVATYFEIGFLIIFFNLGESSNKSRVALVLYTTVCAIVIGSKTSLVLILIFSLIGSKLNIFIRYILFLIFVLHIIVFNYNKTISLFLLSQSELYTAYLRFVLWDKAVVEIFESSISFVFGHGPGNFDTYQLDEGDLNLVNNPHNYILSVLHSYGVLGLLLFIYFLLKILGREYAKNFIYQSCFTLFLLHALFDVGWVKGSGFFIAMITGMITYGIKKKENIQLKHMP